MLTKGCVGYLANIMDTTKKTKTELFDVHIVYKFLDVFEEDFLGLPPGRGIELLS